MGMCIYRVLLAISLEPFRTDEQTGEMPSLKRMRTQATASREKMPAKDICRQRACLVRMSDADCQMAS